jgi:hypothetical protein
MALICNIPLCDAALNTNQLRTATENTLVLRIDCYIVAPISGYTNYRRDQTTQPAFDLKCSIINELKSYAYATLTSAAYHYHSGLHHPAGCACRGDKAGYGGDPL